MAIKLPAIQQTARHAPAEEDVSAFQKAAQLQLKKQQYKPSDIAKFGGNRSFS